MLSLAALGEGVIRADEAGQPFTTIVVVALMFTMLWRRTRPLASTVVGFGTLIVLDQMIRIASGATFEFAATAAVLILPYSLFRWGSGRHAAIGVVVLLAAYSSAIATDWTGIPDAIGGAFVLAFSALLGVEVRHLVGSRRRTLEQAREHERALLARELHDTVAHHVSAIAIRAQAGRVVAAANPAAALDALAVIESEASRTLDEMRTIVGALRGHEQAERLPHPGLLDLEHLADTEGNPSVTVHVTDDIGTLDPGVGSALYRVAQEGVTNARRHARNASNVTVHVTADARCVHLSVHDDGEPTTKSNSSLAGFGLAGMTERANLLGGSLRAGHASPTGWRIDVTIPRGGTP